MQGEISAHPPPPLFVHPFWGLSQTRLYTHLVVNCACFVYVAFNCHVLANIVYIAQYEIYHHVIQTERVRGLFGRVLPPP